MDYINKNIKLYNVATHEYESDYTILGSRWSYRNKHVRRPYYYFMVEFDSTKTRGARSVSFEDAILIANHTKWLCKPPIENICLEFED